MTTVTSTSSSDVQPGDAPDPAAVAHPGRVEVPLDVASLRAAVAPVLDELARTAAAREVDRVHPFAQVRRLGELGVVRLRVPVEDGGAGGTVRDLVELVVEIARADSNVAQALRPSFLVADGLAQDRAPGPDRERTLARVLAGDLFAGTRNEVGGAPGEVSTRVRRDGDGYVVTGRKYYSTGALHARWFSASATDDEGRVVNVTVPTDRPGVHVLDDFDAIGQRLTASGTTVLDEVRVEPHEVRTDTRGRRHPLGATAQLYLAATLAGIAAGVLDDAVRFAREHARPIKHSSARRSVDDPYVRQTVGTLASRAFTARAVVVAAAERLDVAWRTREPADGVAATVAVANAQVAAAREALAAAQELFEVAGGTALRREHDLDRHWRNARAVANHNPVAWKAAVVGDHLLTGEDPPTTGLF